MLDGEPRGLKWHLCPLSWTQRGPFYLRLARAGQDSHWGDWTQREVHTGSAYTHTHTQTHTHTNNLFSSCPRFQDLLIVQCVYVCACVWLCVCVCALIPVPPNCQWRQTAHSSSDQTYHSHWVLICRSHLIEALWGERPLRDT